MQGTDDLTSHCPIRNEHKFADQLMGTNDMCCIAQSMYCERRKVYPVLPKTRGVG